MRLVFGKQVIELMEERLTIGRSAASDIQIPDEAVSRYQALVQRSGGGWLLIDTESANGTFVNGDRKLQHRLQDGDVISFGGKSDPSNVIHVEADAQEISEFDTLQQRRADSSRIEAQLDEVIAQGERQRSRLDALEQKVDQTEQRLEGSIQDLRSENFSLRAADQQQSRENREAVAVLFWLIGAALSLQLAIGIGGAVRRNPTLASAIAEELNNGEDVGRFIGVALAATIAAIAGSSKHAKDSSNAADSVALNASQGGSDRLGHHTHHGVRSERPAPRVADREGRDNPR